MASLLKDGARKPRIAMGYCYTGNNYDTTTTHERGVMPGMCYDLTVAQHEGRAQYTARLTEDEMLNTIKEWLTRHNDHMAQVRRDEARRRETR